MYAYSYIRRESKFAVTHDYSFRTSPPDWADELYRDYKHGEGVVVKEPGVIHSNQHGVTYWKSFQLIRMADGREDIRTNYQTKEGGQQNKPWMLEPHVLADLVKLAEDKIW